MNKATAVAAALLILGCAQDDLHEPLNHSQSPALSVDNISTEAEVFAFLKTHHPEFSDSRIAEVQEMLHASTRAPLSREGNTVELEAGSMNGLQAAIDEAGDGGTVIIKSGTHTETGLVTASHEIHLVGEDASLLTFENAVLTDIEIRIEAGLHLYKASNSSLRNLTVSGGSEGSGNFLFIEESHGVGIHDLTLENLQYSISVEESNNTRVSGTTIIGWVGWLDGLGAGSLGITIINGRGTRLVGNTVSGCQFGMWMCDKGGLSWGNSTTGNFYGQILCNVPAESITTPSGRLSGSKNPGQNWLVALNEDFNNFYAGIVAIDGANSNTLLANKGGGNAAYDLELTADTERFGFLTPQAYNNWVFSYQGYTIKDCGENNRVSGGVQVDTNSDPCM